MSYSDFTFIQSSKRLEQLLEKLPRWLSTDGLGWNAPVRLILGTSSGLIRWYLTEGDPKWDVVYGLSVDSDGVWDLSTWRLAEIEEVHIEWKEDIEIIDDTDMGLDFEDALTLGEVFQADRQCLEFEGGIELTRAVKPAPQKPDRRQRQLFAEPRQAFAF